MGKLRVVHGTGGAHDRERASIVEVFTCTVIVTIDRTCEALAADVQWLIHDRINKYASTLQFMKLQ